MGSRAGRVCYSGRMINRREFIGTSIAAAAVTGSVGATASGATHVSASHQPSGGPNAARFRLAYAPHFGMFSNHAPDDLDQLRFAADQGFWAWEDNGMKGRGPEFQEKAAKVMSERGIRMGIFVGADIDWRNPTLTTGKKEHRDKFVEQVRESVEVAKRINTKTCTIVPGTVAENIPEGIQMANVVEALKRASEVCEASGLVMVNEPLNWRDHPRLFLRYSDQAYAIMKAVNHPCCKILFDMYHQQVTEGNLIDNINRTWDEIGFFQIGDNPGRCEPGTGEVNYRNVFGHIAQKAKESGREFILGMEHGNSRQGKEGELAVIQAYREADGF